MSAVTAPKAGSTRSVLARSADPQGQDALVRPDPGEHESVERLLAQIDALIGRQCTGTLVGPDGDAVTIPESVFALLHRVVHALARGQAVALAPYDAELTTQQAADLLHVSRPHLVKLLERGDIPFHRTHEGRGAHRRVRLHDVLRYREQRAERRREQLRELTQLTQQIEGDYH